MFIQAYLLKRDAKFYEPRFLQVYRIYSLDIKITRYVHSSTSGFKMVGNTWGKVLHFYKVLAFSTASNIENNTIK